MSLSTIPAQFGSGGAGLWSGTTPNLKGLLDELQAHAPKKITKQITHADLTAAATTQSISVGDALPANVTILAANVRVATPFSGGTVSDLKLALGTTGDDDAIIASADVDAATDGVASTRTAGIAPNKFFAAAGAQLLAKFTATGDNVVNLTAGDCTIDVIYCCAT